MLRPGRKHPPEWSAAFMTVFAPLEVQGKGSFEYFICQAIKNGFRICGHIEYVTMPDDSGKDEIWGLTSIIKSSPSEPANENIEPRSKRK